MSFIVLVYVPSWFVIKSSKLHEIPRILFENAQIIKNLPNNDVKKIAFDNLDGNSYALLPQNFLYSLLLSGKPTLRKQALETILQLRELGSRNNLRIAKKIPADH